MKQFNNKIKYKNFSFISIVIIYIYIFINVKALNQSILVVFLNKM